MQKSSGNTSQTGLTKEQIRAVNAAAGAATALGFALNQLPVAKVGIDLVAGSIEISFDPDSSADSAIVDLFVAAVESGGASCASTGDGGVSCSYS